MQAVKKTQNTPSLSLLGEGDSFHSSLCSMLEETSLFSDLDRLEIEYLSRWFKAYSAPAGAVVTREGERAPCLYVVAKGELHVLKETGAYENRRIAQIKAGKSLGEMGILDGCPISATTVAATNSVLLLITQNNFQNVIEQNPKLGVKLLLKLGKMVSLRLRQTSGQLAEFLH